MLQIFNEIYDSESPKCVVILRASKVYIKNPDMDPRIDNYGVPIENKTLKSKNFPHLQMV